MLRDVFAFLGKLYQLLVSLVLVALLSVGAWAMWHFYEEERLQNQFLKEGKVVEVQISDTDISQRSWRDILGNVTYITFPYQHKNYRARVVRDTAWVSSGDRVKLLYHPERDEFRQQRMERKPGRVTSRLVHWSSVGGFSQEHKLLIGFLAVSTFLFFFASGVLVSLTGLTILQTIARFMLVIVLGLAALFFSYDTWVYFQYYRHIKANGQPLEVTVLDKDRHRVGRGSSASSFELYEYDATVNYRTGQRVVPITENEYETLKPKESLRVLYDADLDDLMSATYPGNYSQVIVPLFFWILFLVIFWNTVSGSKTKR
ncbi:hypothetical protein [Larkinella rosea]|uniref:DUF3592 domain-containing protein n=1 Tax=Larkinella rosea TaxID=2025312 RepID=A0A3P1BJY3_9BACT|nr:hypothetical protein [Larkinella rosea]RRB01183.1 hypothetical protein EHT25_23710 [Larkinella rosea]